MLIYEKIVNINGFEQNDEIMLNLSNFYFKKTKRNNWRPSGKKKVFLFGFSFLTDFKNSFKKQSFNWQEPNFLTSLLSFKIDFWVNNFFSWKHYLANIWQVNLLMIFKIFTYFNELSNKIFSHYSKKKRIFDWFQ